MKKILIYFIVAIVSFAIGYYLTPLLMGSRTVNPIWNESELDVRIETDDFANATNTIVSVANPFTATATVDLFILLQDGAATSSYTINCGTSTSAYGSTVAPTDRLIDGFPINTSTVLNYVTNGDENAGTNAKGTNTGW